MDDHRDPPSTGLPFSGFGVAGLLAFALVFIVTGFVGEYAVLDLLGLPEGSLS